MARWTGSTIEYIPAERDECHPSWWRIDCGCCGGISWGGEEPSDCTSCKGRGFLYVHDTTLTMAEFPGGPLLGRMDAEWFASATRPAASSPAAPPRGEDG